MCESFWNVFRPCIDVFDYSSMWNVSNNAYVCIHDLYPQLMLKSVYTYSQAHTHAHTNVACHAQRDGLTTILVVSPTRELAMQIEDEAKKLATYARE